MSKKINSKVIPDEAKCVFKGKIFDTYQWEQKLFDGSFATFEKLKRPDTVSVIPVTSDNKIIVINQKQPNWEKSRFGLPGGRVDEGEDPLEATKRELLEETGYEAKNLEEYSQIAPYDKIEWTIYTYIARDCKKISEQHIDGGEQIEVMEITWEKFIEIASMREFRDEQLTLDILFAIKDRKLDELKYKILNEN